MAEYLFLVILHHSYMEDHNRIQMEYQEFCRYTQQSILSQTNAEFGICNIVVLNEGLGSLLDPGQGQTMH